MENFKILLNSPEKVKAFNHTVSGLEYNIDIKKGNYVIDAKSLLGLLSMDLTHPIEMYVHADAEEAAQVVNNSLSQFCLSVG